MQFLTSSVLLKNCFPCQTVTSLAVEVQGTDSRISANWYRNLLGYKTLIHCNSKNKEGKLQQGKLERKNSKEIREDDIEIQEKKYYI